MQPTAELPEDPFFNYPGDVVPLSRLGLHGLGKDKLFFDARELEGQSSIVKLGFLSKEVGPSKLKLRLYYTFLYKTFQEYFSALFLCEKLVSKEVGGDNFIKEYSGHILKFAQFVIFTAGILAGKYEMSLFVSFIQSLVHTLTTLFVEPVDVVTEQWRQQVTDITFGFLLLCDCVREGSDGGELNVVQKQLCAVIGQGISWKALELSECVNGETSDRWKVLCKVLENNSTVETLDLEGNNLADASFLVESLQHRTTLRFLNLSCNHITDRTGVETLKQHNRNLRIVY